MLRYTRFPILVIIALFTVGCSEPHDDMKLAATYNHQDNEYTYIILYEDGSCDFSFSYFDGLCEAYGSYSTSRDKLVITLTDSDTEFFLNRNDAEYKPWKLKFTIIDENTLQINESLYAAYEGSNFFRQYEESSEILEESMHSAEASEQTAPAVEKTEEDALYDAINNADLEMKTMNTDFPIESMHIVRRGKGRFLADQDTMYWLLSVHSDGAGPFGDFFLCLDVEGDILSHYLGVYHFNYYKLYCVDVDGDGLEEIVLQLSYPAMQGDFNSSRILKFNGISVDTIFHGNGNNMEDDQIGWIDTGFAYSFNDGFTITFYNENTGYEQRVDARDLFYEELLDAVYLPDGTVNTEHPLHGAYFEKDEICKNANGVHEFKAFYPIDIDGDGIYEIIASEDFLFFIQMQIYLGEAFTILRLNTDTSMLEVMDCEFVANPIIARNNPDHEVFGVEYRQIFSLG